MRMDDYLIQCCAVNPQAINQTNLDVFSRNKRSVLFLKHTLSGKPIAFVAIGALLVGSIVWTVEVSRPIESNRALFADQLDGCDRRSDADLGKCERASRRRARLLCVWWKHYHRHLPA